MLTCASILFVSVISSCGNGITNQIFHVWIMFINCGDADLEIQLDCEEAAGSQKDIFSEDWANENYL